jgi:hypothetical protein
MAETERDLVAQYAEIHRSRIYGNTSVKNLRFLRPEVRLLAPRSILDYGCGQSRLLEALDTGAETRLIRYDPAIPAYAMRPAERADLLLNVDVLEHIPEGDLDAVIGEMAGLCRNAIVVVDTRPAAAVLPNGENAHCTLHPHGWWQERLARFFPVLVPIRVARRSRAAFRTWRHTPAEALRFRALRLAEDARYWAGKAAAVAGKGGGEAGKGGKTGG